MPEPRNELKSVYLIYSAHRLLLDDALDRLVSGLGTSDSESMDVCRFTAREANVLDVIAACQTLSFLRGRRLVVVHGFSDFDDASQKSLADYIGNPNPLTILVMTEVVAARQDKRRLLSTAVFKACAAVDAAHVYEYEIKSGLPAWIKANFSARNKVVSAPVVDYLITWVGADLARLKSEIDKLCDGGQEQEIGLSLAKELAVATNEADVFDLINAVVDRDAQAALVRLAPLLEKDAGGSHIFALLERQFQLIFEAKTKGRGLKGQKLASALAVSPGQAFHLEKQSRIFSTKSVKTALKLLVEADFIRKSSPLPTRVLLETLVVDLCAV